jgi:hypothetical protein
MKIYKIGMELRIHGAILDSPNIKLISAIIGNPIREPPLQSREKSGSMDSNSLPAPKTATELRSCAARAKQLALATMDAWQLAGLNNWPGLRGGSRSD